MAKKSNRPRLMVMIKKRKQMKTRKKRRATKVIVKKRRRMMAKTVTRTSSKVGARKSTGSSWSLMAVDPTTRTG